MRKLFSTAIVFGLSAMLAGCPGDGKTGKTGAAKTGKTGAAKTGDAKTGDAKTGDTSGGKTTSTGPIIDHVKEGQKYTSEMVVDNAQMTMTTTTVWTIVSVKPGEEIVYDVESTAAMKFKAAGMPEQKPKTTKTPGQKYPLKVATTTKTDPATKAPEPIKEETIEVDGVKFECKVYENAGTKSWVSRTFPGMVKMEGKTMKQTLKSIE